MEPPSDQMTVPSMLVYDTTAMDKHLHRLMSMHVYINLHLGYGFGKAMAL
jgi:hypothetical protein